MDLMELNDRWSKLLSADQQDFVQAFLVTQTVAAAAKMANIRYSQAKRYIASPTIQAAIKLGQKATRENAHVTAEEVVSDLRLMRDMALGRIPIPETKWVDGEPITKYVNQYNANAANKAVENLGRVVGMFTDKKEITMPASDTQLSKRLSELLGLNLEAADAEFTEVDDSPSEDITAALEAFESSPTDTTPEDETPQEPQISQPTTEDNLPNDLSELSEMFEALADDELTSILAQACDDHGY